MPRKRLRHGADERYAMLPNDVRESDAYRCLPHYARSVLIEIAGRYNGVNNGDLSFTKADAHTQGISAWEWGSALHLLGDEHGTGLIEKTRQGKVVNGKGVANLFALSWRPLNASDKYDQPATIARAASHAWAKWVTPANWLEVVAWSKRTAQGKREESAEERETRARFKRTKSKKLPVHPSGPSQSTRVDRKQLEPVHAGGLGSPDCRSTRADSSRDLGDAPAVAGVGTDTAAPPVLPRPIGLDGGGSAADRSVISRFAQLPY